MGKRQRRNRAVGATCSRAHGRRTAAAKQHACPIIPREGLVGMQAVRVLGLADRERLLACVAEGMQR